MLLDIMSYYMLFALVTHIYCWIKIWPTVFGALKLIGMDTGKEGLVNMGGFGMFTVVYTLIISVVLWHILSLAAIFKSAELKKNLIKEFIRLDEK